MDMELIRKVEYPVLGQRPVEILRSRLYQDKETLQVFLSLDLRNVSGKTVTAVYLDLCCFDDAVNLIATKNMVPFEDLTVADNDDFGEETRVELSSLRIRSITATVHRVCFDDGTLWDIAEGESHAKKHRLSALAEELKDILTEHGTAGEKKRRKKRLAAILIPVVLAVGLGVGFGIFQSGQEAKLSHAMTLFQEKQYADAADAFAALGEEWIPGRSRGEIGWFQAMAEIQDGCYADAAAILATRTDHAPSALALRQLNGLLAGVVSCGESHTVALCTDGTALATGKNNEGQCEVGAWHDLVAVTAGANHSLGLKSDGTVVYAGNPDSEKANVKAWGNVIGIAAGEQHSVGVLANGRVVALGDNTLTQCDTQNWSGVVAVAAGSNHTVGLRQDGTVYATGDNANGCCNVEKWKNIISIAAGNGFTLGLTAEGSILAAGNGECWGDFQTLPHMVSAVRAGVNHSLALGTDGILHGAGADDLHQSRVSHLQSILSADGGAWHSVGVRTDGTAVSVGANTHGQGEVRSWSNLGLPKKALRLTALETYKKAMKQ